MRPGPLNLITDVADLRVGNAQDARLKSGVTVLTADAPFACGVHVIGGAPGTRETDLLAPDRLVGGVDALVLSGGSAFGLAACAPTSSSSSASSSASATSSATPSTGATTTHSGAGAAAATERTTAATQTSKSKSSSRGSETLKEVRERFSTLAPGEFFDKLDECSPSGISGSFDCSGDEIGQFQFFDSESKAASTTQLLTELRSSRVVEDDGDRIVGWSTLGTSAIITVVDNRAGQVLQQLVSSDQEDPRQRIYDLGLATR